MRAVPFRIASPGVASSEGRGAESAYGDGIGCFAGFEVSGKCSPGASRLRPAPAGFLWGAGRQTRPGLRTFGRSGSAICEGIPEPPVGIEPTTYTLPWCCSTTELQGRRLACGSYGAGGENRTRDFCLEGRGITTMQRPRPWWAGLDSNQRSAFAHQVYSLAPLTTRPPTQSAAVLGLGPAPGGPPRSQKSSRRFALASDSVNVRTTAQYRGQRLTFSRRCLRERNRRPAGSKVPSRTPTPSHATFSSERLKDQTLSS